MIGKIFKIRFSEKVLAVLSVAALIVALIPLYRLAFYAVPRYDDFSYGPLIEKLNLFFDN